VLADGDATQDEVDDAFRALVDALDQLDEFVDTAALEALVTSAALLDANAYTPASWAVLADALTTARAVLADPESTQADVGAAAVALVAARDALVEADVAPGPGAADRAGLQAAVDSAQALVRDGYTAESWDLFSRALTTAREVLGDASATQAGVDAARSALVTAQGALVAVAPDGPTPADDGPAGAPESGDSRSAADLAITGAAGWGTLTLTALVLLVLGSAVVVLHRRRIRES
jgi:hypothetical protein